MRPAPWIALAAGLALSFNTLTAASAEDTVSINTARGPVDVSASPGKVVVLDMSVFDTLTALGIKPAGVTNKVYLDYLEEAAEGIERVGTLHEPDLEAIHAIQPDLIIAGGRSATKVDTLAGLAPTLDMTLGTEDYLSRVRQTVRSYGKLFALEDKAAALDGNIAEAIERVSNGARGAGKALVILTNGPKISAYGPGSRFGWIHTDLGIEPAMDDIATSTHGEAVSFEFIREADPDWLIVIDRAAAVGGGAALAAETLDNELVAGTRAWSSGQVIYLDAGRVYIATGGYQSLMDTLNDLSTAFETNG